MRVLVTGARGFIGRPCVAELVRRGHEVHGISSARDPSGSAGVTWHHADLLSRTGAAAVLRRVRPSHLVHLAWITTPGEFWASPANDEWFAASRRLLGSFLESGGARVVAAGSVAEYDWRGGVCDEAATPLRPATPYGRSKNALREHL